MILGIDPGVNGALALLDDREPSTSDVRVWDMPVLAAEGKKGRRIIDGRALLRLLAEIEILRFAATPGSPLTAWLEDVRSMPRDGHVGAFAFGRSFGTIETALAAQEIPFRTVRPMTWKQRLGVQADKDHARLIAGRLMPRAAKHWPLVKHDGRAEAALIAYYGAKIAA